MTKIRKAGVMFVHKNKFDEYEKRHNELWQEMKTAIHEHGGSNYSIFLEEETGKLFSYIELESEEKWEQLAQTDICKKWWAYMQDIMETNSDNSPIYQPLRDVFYLG
ncbi:MAG: L-rhamnose mutarotase [Defluviitaleaceae bacterium]|nr:L-rhamnose mutarotase [Defluviitaleaceae bacterium]